MSVDDIIDVNELSTRILNHANKLADVSRRFNGYEDPQTKEKFNGVKLEFEEAVEDEVDRLSQQYEDAEKRAPAKEILYIRARKAVKKANPDLYSEYFILAATKERIERWISDGKSALWGRKEVLRTERELAGRT